jgi:hypothetical protein
MSMRSKRLYSLVAVVLSLMALVAQPAATVYAAMPPGQAHVFNNDIYVFNIEDDKPTSGACSAGAGNGVPLVGADNIKKAFNYFVTTRGLTPAQSAGIVANLLVESDLNPSIVQGGGTSDKPVPGKGYGIGQWTTADRQAGLIKLAQTSNRPVNDLGLQLDYLWQELTTTYINALNDLKAGTVYDKNHDAAWNAALSVMIKFEAPKDHAVNGANAGVRGNLADTIANQGGPSNIGATAGGAVGCPSGGTVNCTPEGGAAEQQSSTLSPTRVKVICLARQEVVAWQQPGIQRNVLCNKYGAGNPCEEWCADFVSWVYKQAGYPFTPDRIAAVQGIWDMSLRSPNFHFHPAAGYTPKPGDIAIHKIGRSHTNIVVDVTGNRITLIGGDQGPGPYGGPNSNSIVSQVYQEGPTLGGTNGYVSPD